MSPAFNCAYLDTIGIEFESVGLAKENVYEYLSSVMPVEMSNGKLAVTTDASVQMFADRIRLGNRTFLMNAHAPGHDKIAHLSSGKTTMGYEIVTSPLEIPELTRITLALTQALENMGDFTSPRASTHFHIGFANNLRILKNMLTVGLALDPVMFRLGGMGGTFRGATNNAAYTRPLMNSLAVPIVGGILPNVSTAPVEFDPDDESHEEEGDLNELDEFETALSQASQSIQELLSKTKTGKYAQIINPEKALEARTLDEFWASFGIQYPSMDLDKYHPARYTGINFFGIPAHGTLEFRHCNQTLDPFLIIAVAKFLRAVVEMSTIIDKNELAQFVPVNPHVEISTGDAAEIVQRIMYVCQAKEIDPVPSRREIELLLDTIDNSHFEPLPETPVLIHLDNKRIRADMVKKGGLRILDEVLPSSSVTIHNIKNVTLFD